MRDIDNSGFEAAFEAGSLPWPLIPDADRACCSNETFMLNWADGFKQRWGQGRGSNPAYAGCDLFDQQPFAAFFSLMCTASQERLTEVGRAFSAPNTTACPSDLAAALKQVGGQWMRAAPARMAVAWLHHTPMRHLHCPVCPCPSILQFPPRCRHGLSSENETWNVAAWANVFESCGVDHSNVGERAPSAGRRTRLLWPGRPSLAAPGASPVSPCAADRPPSCSPRCRSGRVRL